MSSDPSFPKDAAVGDVKSAASAGADQAQKDEGGEDKAKGNNKWLKRGAAVGVGSAALVAALLYANRSRKAGGDKKD